MTVEEIYVLNRALDGADIFGLPAFKNIGMSNLLVKEVKKRLIEMKILESESTFTMNGMQTVKRMSDYKEAQKYVKLNGLILGITVDDLAIALVKEKVEKRLDYKFVPTDISDCYSQLCSRFPFLLKATASGQSRSMSHVDLRKEFDISGENAIRISTYSSKGKCESDEVLFQHEGQLYLYDETTNEIANSFDNSESRIIERLV